MKLSALRWPLALMLAAFLVPAFAGTGHSLMWADSAAAVDATQQPAYHPVAITQMALFDASGSGSTAVVEIRDPYGAPVLFKDAAGATYSRATITLGSGAYAGFGYLITQTKPDTTNALASISSTSGAQLGYRVLLRTVSGSIAINYSGTYDSSVGTGSGIATGQVAPDGSNTTVLAIGTTYLIGPGGTMAIQGQGLVPVTQSGTWTVVANPSPTTSGGNTTAAYQNGALTNTVVAIKASAGNFYGYCITNLDATHPVTVEVFSVATGSVSLGTTVPLWHITLQGGQTANRTFAIPYSSATALSLVAVSAYNGSSAPSTAIDVCIEYN